MAWSRPFFGGAFFGGGFFGGTGTTAGPPADPKMIGRLDRFRLPEDEAAAREAFGAIPEEVMAIIGFVARRYAMDEEWNEDDLRKELMRRLSAFPWSSHYMDALMAELERERRRVKKLAGQMRYFRIAPCGCGGAAAAEVEEGMWRVRCPDCGEEGEADERPVVAVRGWNAERR